MNMTENEAIKEFIKENYEPVEDKPGYVWFNKRNFRIISIETLTKALEDGCKKGLYHIPFRKKEPKVEIVTRGNCIMCGKILTEGFFFCKECKELMEKYESYDYERSEE